MRHAVPGRPGRVPVGAHVGRNVGTVMAIAVPYLGHGVGLRPTHYPAILDEGRRADWFEVISENYMLRGGRPLHVLERVRAERPIVLHGVSLSLGASDALNADYLAELRALASR